MRLNAVDNCGLEKYIQRITALLEEIILGKKTIVIFGAGENGLRYQGFLETIGIKIGAFVDNNKSLWGGVKRGYKVVSPDVLKESEDIVVLISFPVKKTLCEVVAQCELLEVESFFDDTLYYLLHSKINGEKERVNEIIKSMYLIKNEKTYLNMPIMAPNLVTTNCTLRCRDCSLRIPYLEKRGDLSCTELISDLKRALEVVDTITTFDVSGGETLLYHELVPFLQKVKMEPKVFSIRITTNGTVIPDNEVIEELKNSNIVVKISDYGELSYKKNELEELLLEESIPYWIQDYSWYDLTPDMSLHYTYEELQKMFDECEWKDCCIRNFHGRIIRCGCQEIWRIHKLIPAAEEGADLGVDLNDKADDVALKERLRNYLNRREPFDICRYCKGKSQRLPRAVQLKEKE